MQPSLHLSVPCRSSSRPGGRPWRARRRPQRTRPRRATRFDKMKPAVDALSAKILTLQGDGDHASARAFLDQYGKVGPELQSDLDRIEQKNIPVDIVFKQGREVLGL